MRLREHIFVFIITTLTIVACESVEIPSYETPYEMAITYNTSVAPSRATETTTETITDNGSFNIATFLTDTDKSHYYTDKVNYANSTWSSDVTRYWSVEYGLDMFAYTPYTESATIDNPHDRDDYQLTYNCPSDVDEQKDLLVKTLTNQRASTNGGATPLKFDHALSSIKFNVKFTAEKNVTLQRIDIKYIGIDSKSSYNFATQSWGETSEPFKGANASTSIGVYEQLKMDQATSNYLLFDKIEKRLMIIPQELNFDNAPQHLAVQIYYTLNSGMDNIETQVVTGLKPIPGSSYLKGHEYTYTMVINGETISFQGVSIEDQDATIPAYGNIDLALINKQYGEGTINGAITYDEYKAEVSKYSGSIVEADSIKAGPHLYYQTAVRAFKLLNDGVRDFVVVGSFGADADAHDGKMGNYGSTTSPFYIAAKSLGMIPHYEVVVEGENRNMVFDDPEEQHLFSIDLRGVYGFPKFADTHSAVVNQTLDPDAPVLTKGLFKDLPLLDEVTFPHGLLAIGNYAFQNCISLKSVDLADIVHIEPGGFVDCRSLTDVYNGKLTRVHDNGFDDCMKLVNINLSLLEEVNTSGFVNCESLGEVDLSSLKKVDQYGFGGCKSMTLSTPNMTQLESVGYGGFQYCSSLGEVNLGASTLTTIGDHAFSNCTNLHFADSPMVFSTLNTIGEYAFQNCANIGEIELPLIKNIAAGAFTGCTNVELTGDIENLRTIGAYAFQDCTNIGTVDFKNITSIGALAFINCKLLKFTGNNDLSNLTTIEAHTFQGCTSIDKDDLNLDKVTIIKDYGFQGCSSLQGVSLDTADSLGVRAFENCSSLKTLYIPEVTDFGLDFISGCTSLTRLETRDLVNNISTLNDKGGNSSNIFELAKNCNKIEELILPNVKGKFGGWEWYSSHTYEDGVITGDREQHIRIADLSAVDELIGGTFFGNETLEVLDLSGMTIIGGNALQYCTKLLKLDIRSLEDYTDTGKWSFANIPNGQCEIWLSDAQMDNVTGEKWWQGVEWKEIHRASEDFSY